VKNLKVMWERIAHETIANAVQSYSPPEKLNILELICIMTSLPSLKIAAS
jgi:hypothetical protein